MLKYFYKTFLVAILCGSLLMLDFSVRNYNLIFGMQTARAASQSVSTGGADDGGMAATLEMAAIGLVASRLWKYGKLTPDVMVAAAGGAAFVAGEILAYLKLKEAKKKIETAIQTGKNGDITDEQRQNIIRLIQMYQAAKETAETKKNLQLAAAAAFAAAGVMAYFYTAADWMTIYQCQVALTGGAQTVLNATAVECAALTAGTYTAAQGAACWANYNACQAKLATTVATYNSFLASRVPPEPTLSQLPAVTAAGATFQADYAATNAACTGYTSGVSGAISPCGPVPVKLGLNMTGASAPIPTAYSPNYLNNKKYFDVNDLFKPEIKKDTYAINSNNNAFSNFINKYLISNAKADLFTPMGIASSAAIALVMAFSSTIATAVDLNILVPQRRGIIWGVMAAGAYAASSATSSAIEQIQGDIDKLNNLLNTINSQSSGNNASAAVVQNSSTTGSNLQTNTAISINSAQEDVDISEGGKYKLPCLTGDGANGKCDSVSSQLNNAEVLSAIPEGMKTNVLNIGKMADGLSNTSKISGSTLASANSVAASANALKAALNKQKLETQKILKDNGSSVDLNKESKDAEDALNKSFNDNLKNSKSKLSDIYASLGSNFTSGAASNALGTDAKKGSASAVKTTVPVATGSFGSGAKVKMVETKLDEDKNAANAVAASENKDASATMDDYEIKNDITTDKSTNIFDVISTRYQKSGYPRLFKRISE